MAGTSQRARPQIQTCLCPSFGLFSRWFIACSQAPEGSSFDPTLQLHRIGPCRGGRQSIAPCHPPVLPTGAVLHPLLHPSHLRHPVCSHILLVDVSLSVSSMCYIDVLSLLWVLGAFVMNHRNGSQGSAGAQLAFGCPRWMKGRGTWGISPRALQNSARRLSIAFLLPPPEGLADHLLTTGYLVGKDASCSAVFDGVAPL